MLWSADKEAMKSDIMTLLNDDCRAILPVIASNSIDLVIADPPYNIGIADWDVIPDYVDFMTGVYQQLKRIAPQRIIFFDYSYHALAEALDPDSIFERFIWHREGGYRGNSIKKGYEPFYWYGDGSSYNRMTEINFSAPKDKRLQPERTISNVWTIPNLVGKKKEALNHPSQKPLALISRIIQMASKPGDVILDPFMGTGTAGEACAKLGRSYIGIEKDPKYYLTAVGRIKGAQNRSKTNFFKGV